MKVTCGLVMTFVLFGLTPTFAADEPQSEPVDPGTLRIDIGRLSVISRATSDIASQLPSLGPGGRTQAELLDLELRAAVFEYNAHRADMCARVQFVEITCGRPWLPAWVTSATKPEPSLETLHARKNDVEQRVVKLWDDVCAAARVVAKAVDTSGCSVE